VARRKRPLAIPKVQVVSISTPIGDHDIQMTIPVEIGERYPLTGELIVAHL